MRPATSHHMILRGPSLQGRARLRQFPRSDRQAEEASGREVNRSALHHPLDLSFLATSRITGYFALEQLPAESRSLASLLVEYSLGYLGHLFER